MELSLLLLATPIFVVFLVNCGYFQKEKRRKRGKQRRISRRERRRRRRERRRERAKAYERTGGAAAGGKKKIRRVQVTVPRSKLSSNTTTNSLSTSPVGSNADQPSTTTILSDSSTQPEIPTNINPDLVSKLKKKPHAKFNSVSQYFLK